MSDKIKAIHGDVEAVDFLQRHFTACAREQRFAAGHRQRHRRAAERGRQNAAQGGVRGLWGGVEGELRPPLDPKRAHRRGACAVVRGRVVVGEDGCEALQVLDTLCRKMVRQMRNPEARHKAHTLHHTARSFTPVPGRVHTGAERGATTILMLARERGG